MHTDTYSNAKASINSTKVSFGLILDFNCLGLLSPKFRLNIQRREPT